MSRSYREPYFGNSSGSKWWKRAFNKKVRRSEEDCLDGSFFKKMNEVWCSAMENAHGYWDEPKMRRK